MKNFFPLLLALLVTACKAEPTPSNVVFLDSVGEAIKYRIDADGLGMLQKIEVIHVKQRTDSTFKATHTFWNPMTEEEVKLSREYTMNSNLDSVVSKEEISSSFIKRDGTWIATDW
ncbi:hypothetical protein N9233_01360 [Flavobacteriales bacterium]|nr:hypothetical protein [Flavobacteriales bacterium]MDB4493820.1 hypothetical protein [Flavobacteriales bacterium]